MIPAQNERHSETGNGHYDDLDAGRDECDAVGDDKTRIHAREKERTPERGEMRGRGSRWVNNRHQHHHHHHSHQHYPPGSLLSRPVDIKPESPITRPIRNQESPITRLEKYESPITRPIRQESPIPRPIMQLSPLQISPLQMSPLQMTPLQLSPLSLSLMHRSPRTQQKSPLAFGFAPSFFLSIDD